MEFWCSRNDLYSLARAVAASTGVSDLHLRPDGVGVH